MTALNLADAIKAGGTDVDKVYQGSNLVWPPEVTDPGGGSYVDEVLADNPWGFWRCDEAAGPTLADSSGNNRPLTITGAPAFNQDGPADEPAIAWPAGLNYAISAANMAPGSGGNLTYEALVFLTAYDPDRTWICGRASAVENNTSYDALTIGPDGSVRMRIWDGISNQEVAVLSAGAIPLNTWCHVVASTSLRKIRINKVTLADPVSPVGATGNSRILLHAGGRGGASSDPLTSTQGAARIAFFAVYQTQLSDARTDAHYDALLA